RRAASRARQLTRAIVETLESRTLLTGSPYEDRGWVSVIVDNTVASDLSEKLAQFKSDLIGDGHTRVTIHTDAPRMDDENYVWSNSQL
ncbi:MAG: hypothetical protein ACREJC_13825, partial [Tepidisphaeraceae bacterium]